MSSTRGAAATRRPSARPCGTEGAPTPHPTRAPRWRRVVAAALATLAAATGGASPARATLAPAHRAAPVAGVAHAVAAEMTFSASALTFRSTAATPTPGQQEITITNGGTTALTGLAVGAVAYGAGQPTGWLSAFVGAGIVGIPAGQSTKLYVKATPGALAEGVYTASIPVTSTNGTPASQTITVRFEVAGPTLAVTPQTASFASTAATPTPAGQTVTVGNVGSTTLSGLRLSPVTYGAGATAWLQASIGRSTMGPGVSTPVTVRALPGTLAAGTYRASFTVLADNAANSGQAVDVTFTVEGPRIAAAAQSVTLASTATTPNPQRLVALTNAGSTTLTGLRVGTVTYGTGQPTGWLSASLGACCVFAPGAGTNLSLATAAGALPAGTYTATVPVLADNASETSVAVTLSVEGARIALEPATLAFDDATSERLLLVRNTGSSGLTGVSVGAVTYTSGATGWLTSALRFGQAFPVRAGDAAGITVRVDPAKAPEGTHTARFTVAGANAGNGPLTAEVTYVRGSARIVVNPATHVETAGGTESFLVSVSNGGAGTIAGLRVDSISYAAGEPTGWLAARLTATTTPTTMTGTVTLGALVPGRYHGTAWVSAPGVATPATLAVVYVVPKPEITWGPSSKQWTVDLGTATTAPATFEIGSRGPTALTGLAIARITYATPERGRDWLTATLAGTTAPTALTVQAAPAALAVGNHWAYVVLASPHALKTDSVTVLVTVLQPPRIVLRASDHATELDRIILTADVGGADAAAHTASVQNGGGGTLNGLTLGTVTYTGGQPTGWVRAALAGTAAPTTLSVGAAIAGLPAGVYEARVPVTSPVATNSGEALRVTLTVRAAPAIVLSPATITKSILAGDASPAEERVSVGSSNGAPFRELALGTVTYTGGATGWLTTRMERMGDAQYSLYVAPSAGALPPGEYVATVPVRASNATAPVALTYTLRVAARATIVLSPTAVTLSAINSGTSSEAVQVDVSNGGGSALATPTLGAVEYLTAGSGWLNLSIAATGNTTGPVARVTLQGVPAGLANGEYRARVPVLAAGASNSPQHVAVRFLVGPAPALAAAPNAVAFDAVAGGGSPAARPVAITNAGVGGIEDVALDGISYTSGQPTGWLAVSLDRSVVPATLTVTPTLGTLAAGTYTAAVRLRSATAVNSPLSIPVTLRVTRAAAIALAPSTVTFQAEAGGAAPGPQQVAITNAGDGALSGLAAGTIAYGAGASGWLTAMLSGTTAPTTLTLAASPAGLAAGTYTATVPVRATGNLSAAVTVTFTVRNGVVLALSAEQVLISTQTRSPSTRSARIAVSAVGTTPVSGLAAAVAYPQGQTGGWLTALWSATTTPATLTLRASTYAMPMGLYAATATVSAATGAPRPIAATLEVIDLNLALAALGDASKLPAAIRTWLDERGNRNGSYDLGDYEALRARISAP
jgi:uncharacterized membrane protein